MEELNETPESTPKTCTAVEPEISIRTLKNHDSDHTYVAVCDIPGEGGACHVYQVLSRENDDILGHVDFQNGPIKENGINGLQNEDLLSIVIDRLAGFQSGEFACVPNWMALQHLTRALEFLSQRTKDRQERNVEGTNQQ